jgi:hypothetical protein
MILRGKFIAMNAHVKKTERSQIINLMLHLKILEKQEAKCKTSTRKQIIKIRAKINELEAKKSIQRIQIKEKLVL